MFVLLVAGKANAQQLSFKGEMVDSLVISSRLSIVDLSDHSRYGTIEEYVIVFDLNRNKYILASHIRKDYTTAYQPRKSTEKEIVFKKGKEISHLKVENVLKQFEINYKKPEFSNLEISPKEFARLVAKNETLNSSLKRSNISKEKKDGLLKTYQHIDSLNLFLATAFDTSEYVMVTDFSDQFNIRIVTTSSNYLFEGKYPYPCRQPWYDRTTLSVLDAKPILNLSANVALVQILPRNFSRLYYLTNELLIEEYIQYRLQSD